MIAPSDWVVLALAFLSLGGLVGGGELLRRWGCPPAGTRRLVHAGVGLFVVSTPLLFTAPIPVYVLAGAFVLINAGAKARRLWPGIHAARPQSWGTVAMPLALIPALVATWSVDPGRVYILQVAFLILALADPLASWVGGALGRREWVPEATLVGSAAFASIAFVLTIGVLVGAAEWQSLRAAEGAMVMAAVTTAAEAMGRRGWDNLFIVLGSLLVLVPLHETDVSAFGLVLAAAGGLAFGVGACVAQALDGRGAIGGGLFAFSLIGLGGWAWALPGFVFFVLSSMLSRLEGRATDDGEGAVDRRTLRQVLANGGGAWGMLSVFVLLPDGAEAARTACYAGFLGALAAAAADTWATEIGGWASARPWSLRTGTRVAAGASGAVSLGGTIAAALGAGSVALAAAVATDGPIPIAWTNVVGVIGAGVAGMTVDSLAGAFLQARYRDLDGDRLVESAAEGAVLVQGWRRVDNETVNLLGTTTGALAALLFG